MAHDAPDQSLSEHDRALLEAARRAAVEAAREELLRVAAAASEPPAPVPRTRKGTPNPHRLHVVRGLGLPVAATGAFVRGHVRHAVVTAAGAAVLAGGTLSPDLMQPAPAAQAPAVPAVHHRRHEVHRHPRPPAPGDVPVVVVPRRKRRRAGGDDSATPGARPSPSPSPSPSVPASPAPSPSPSPSPLPSVTVPPVLGPVCVLVTGEHCGGEVVVTERALRGVAELS